MLVVILVFSVVILRVWQVSVLGWCVSGEGIGVCQLHRDTFGVVVLTSGENRALRKAGFGETTFFVLGCGWGKSIYATNDRSLLNAYPGRALGVLWL